jgi:hypothetical protein
MYSNDSAVLGTSTVAVPTILGIVLWPNLIIYILIAAFLAFGALFFFYKRRNRAIKKSK